MPATQRLFRLIQILRSVRRPVKAKHLADELGVSVRTIYRDVAELRAQHVPVAGEAGVGYMLKAGYDMPPLMLTANEIEAAFVGMHWVLQRGDTVLAQGARDLLAKITAVLPAHLQSVVLEPSVTVPNWIPPHPDGMDMGRVREAIRQGRKLRIDYQNAQKVRCTRTIWPFMVAYFEKVRLIVAWCELRADFRHFRTDRILDYQVLDLFFPKSIEALQRDWQANGHGCLPACRTGEKQSSGSYSDKDSQCR